MTETEWLDSTDPVAMLENLQHRTTTRKLRLFSCACCRTIWNWIADERSRRSVICAERYADSLLTEDERQVVLAEAVVAFQEASSTWNDFACKIYKGGRNPNESELATENTLAFRITAAVAARGTLNYKTSETFLVEAGRIAHRACQVLANAERHAASGEMIATLLRDIVGNYFCPTKIDGHLRTPLVNTLAQSIYDDRAFFRMPELGDALEAEGCIDAEILARCRSERPHMRGCWAIDLILGKN